MIRALKSRGRLTLCVYTHTLTVWGPTGREQVNKKYLESLRSVCVNVLWTDRTAWLGSPWQHNPNSPRASWTWKEEITGRSFFCLCSFFFFSHHLSLLAHKQKIGLWLFNKSQQSHSCGFFLVYFSHHANESVNFSAVSFGVNTSQQTVEPSWVVNLLKKKKKKSDLNFILQFELHDLKSNVLRCHFYTSEIRVKRKKSRLNISLHSFDQFYHACTIIICML